MATDLPGPHHNPHRVQFAVPGQMPAFPGRGATLIVIRDEERGGWAFSLDGPPKLAITVLDPDVMGLIRGLTAEIRVCGCCSGLGVRPPTAI